MTTRKQDIQYAIREMLKKYTDCPENNIFVGYGKNITLPSTNNYIVFTILNPFRYDTPRVITGIDKDNKGFRKSFQDYRVEVQIDFYGDFAFDRANDIINISRTEFLCEFLKPYGIQPIACDDARNLTGVSGEREYVERWTVNLEIDYEDTVTDSQDSFNTVELNIFETEF